MSSHALVLSLALCTTSLASQAIPMEAESFLVNAESCEFRQHMERDAMLLRQGTATVADLDFARGTIEFDIAFGSSRGFEGVKFHIEDAFNCEHVYLRPHQSGNPDASQYQPVVQGHAAWQLCYGPQYANPREHNFEGWQHVRIVVGDDGADVYVDDDAPLIQVRPLLHRSARGAVALTSAYAPAWFSNLVIRESEDVKLTPVRQGAATMPEGLIDTWSVSEAFAEEHLSSPLPPRDTSWTTVRTSIRGIANLAEAVTPGGPNTVVARAVITSDEARDVTLDLGFSDRAVVYLNGRMLFSGNHNYASQDYRFLGTIGRHDTVVLPLDVGDNDLAIAVTEDFGGWGITARLQPTSGVVVQPAR